MVERPDPEASKREGARTESALNVERVCVPYDQVLAAATEILERVMPADYVAPDQIRGFHSPADLVAHSLVDADAQGHPTHGINRIIDYAEAVQQGRVNPHGKFTIQEGSSMHAVCRGNRNFGQVTSQLALQHAFDSIGDQALFTVTASDMYHAGRLEWYLRQIARNGYAGFATLNVGGSGRVAPFPDGLEARYGTNPMGIAVPDGKDGIVVDFASSAVTEGLVNVCKTNGLCAPDGVLQTHDGQPTTDPSVLYNDPKGSLLPMAGNKGSGLAQTIEMFVALLTGRKPEDSPSPKTNALVLNIVNVARFQPTADAYATVASIRKHIQSCPTVSGEPVLMPGEGGLARAQQARKDGIHVHQQTWQNFEQLHQRLMRV